MDLNNEFLKNEWNKAKKGIKTPDCRESCTNCGICKADLKNVYAKPANKENIQIKDTAPYQGKSFFYRCYYGKLNDLKFVAYLDLMRMIYRLIKASDFPLIYTHGFNKHPKLKFGPPLSVGLEGENEYFDFSLKNPFSINVLEKRLQQIFPPNLPVKKINPLKTKKDRKKQFNREILTVEFPPEMKESFQSNLSLFNKKETWIYERKRKNKIKTKDLKKIIERIEIFKNRLFIQKKLTGANVFNIFEEIFEIKREDTGSFRIIRNRLLE